MQVTIRVTVTTVVDASAGADTEPVTVPSQWYSKDNTEYTDDIDDTDDTDDTDTIRFVR